MTTVYRFYECPMQGGRRQPNACHSARPGDDGVCQCKPVYEADDPEPEIYKLFAPPAFGSRKGRARRS